VVLGLGLLGLVLRSLVVTDVFWWRSPRVSCHVAFGGGDLWIKRTVIDASDSFRFRTDSGYFSPDGNWWRLRRNSTFAWNMAGTPYTDNYSVSVDVLVPIWAILPASTTAMLLVQMARARRTQRLNSGLCLRCGYDLRATPDRCPECGSVPAGRASA
jgi:hypothetical protein